MLRVLRELPAAQQETIIEVTKRMGHGMAEFVQMDCRQVSRQRLPGARVEDPFPIASH